MQPQKLTFLILGNEQLERLHPHLNGGGGVVGLLLRAALPRPHAGKL